MRLRDPLNQSLLVLALVLAASSANAQTRPLYTIDGYGPPHLYSVQGGTVTNQVTAGGQSGYAIAVGSTIRTYGGGYGNWGTEYSLGLTPMGGSYTNTTGCCFYDGASDGRYNYAVQHPYDNAVWRAGLDWSGMTQLFSFEGFSAIGITYDSGNNSIWLGEIWNSSPRLFQYALDGRLLSSFMPAIGGSSITALAYDAADGTLWFSDYSPNATLYHYTTTGTQLGSMNVSGTYGGYLLGAEFETAAVPEPASLVLFGTGLLGVAGMAARRRRA